MYRILMILSILFLGSCDSWIDVKPENQVTNTNFFEDEKDVEAAVLQLLGTESAYVGGEGDYQKWLGMLADEWTTTYADPKLWRVANLANRTDNAWKNMYDIVFLANTILENAPRADMTQDRLNFWLGQAAFAKSLAYFNITRLYGDGVITKNSTSLEKYGRKAMLEVIDTAVVNAKKAYDLLPLFENIKGISGASITSKQYAAKGSAAALLAHLYAWRGSVIDLYGLEGDANDSYQQSITYSTEILEKKVGFYEMQPDPETLCEVMSEMGAYNKESIFELELNPLEDYAAPVRVLGFFLTGYPVNVTATLASQNYRSFRLKWSTVEQMYESQDKRINAYFYTDASVVDHPELYPYAFLRKWRKGFYLTYSGSTTTYMSALRANQVQWRVADIYLLRAECREKLGLSGAEEDLNAVRDRAGATAYPTAGENDLKLAIFKERERELIYENHRYLDVIRNGKAYISTYFGTQTTSSGVTEESILKTVTEEELKDGILFQPIPESAFLMNNLMRQTPFWLKYVKY